MELLKKKTIPFRRSVGFFLVFLLIFSGFIAAILQNPTNVAANGATYIQSQATGTGSQVTSTTVTMSKAVNQGDLLVGVFLQYNSTGQVHVSDNINGAWTRAGGEKFSSTLGDIALYYKEKAASSSSGIKITVSSDKATYLQSAVAEYSGVATANSLGSVACSKGVGTSVNSGNIASIPQGDLVYAGLQTGGSPSGFTSGSSQGIAFVKRMSSSSGTEGVEDVLASNVGIQNGTFTLSKSTDWYTCAAAFNPQALVPTATFTPTPTVIPTPTPTAMPTPTATPIPTAIPTVTPTPTATPTATPTPVPSITVSPTPTVTPTPPPGGLANIKNVFVIAMENHNWSDIKGSTSAAYINNTLLPMASHAEQYYNPSNTHPSAPNYVWLEAGAAVAGQNDCFPNQAGCSYTGAHLSSLLDGAGIPWKEYAEGASGTSCILDASPVDVNHVPFSYFTDVTNNNNSSSANCIAHERPFTELATDLQNNTVAGYNFITPNLIDDMHDGTIAQGDTWLSQEVPMIMNSQAYKNGGAIFITWDEGEGTDGPIGMVVLSPYAKGNGYSNTVHYDHSSTLRTMEEIFGVSPMLGGAATATDLSDLFNSVAPAPTPTTTPISTPTATPVPTITPSVTPTPTVTPTVIPTPTSTPIPTPTVTPTPIVIPTATPTPTSTPSAVTFVQAQALSPGNKFASEQIVFANPVKAGDLLVGWFAEYDAPGQVSVSDNVNGAWTRATSEHFSNGGGDLALYYKLNSAPSQNFVITVSANASTYLPYAVSEYSGLSPTASVDQIAVASGNGSHEVAGPTASIGAGELVFGGEITGGIPASFTVGSSQGIPFIKRATNIDSGSTGVEDILTSASGPQNSDFTISSTTDWYSVVATIKP